VQTRSVLLRSSDRQAPMETIFDTPSRISLGGVARFRLGEELRIPVSRVLLVTDEYLLGEALSKALKSV